MGFQLVEEVFEGVGDVGGDVGCGATDAYTLRRDTSREVVDEALFNT